VVAEPLHIRPELARDVEAFLGFQRDLRRVETNLRAWFAQRLAREGLTAAEMAMVSEAVERQTKGEGNIDVG
jgi:hypothetical protein